MAFTGTAVVKQISDSIVRITGLSLATASAVGTIGLHGDTGADVQLPDSFNPTDYEYGGSKVKLNDAIDCTTKPATAVTTSIPISVTKGGTPFRITLTNTHGSLGSPGLEIYVKFHE